jgi:ankyrin repeat protein
MDNLKQLIIDNNLSEIKNIKNIYELKNIVDKNDDSYIDIICQKGSSEILDFFITYGYILIDDLTIQHLHQTCINTDIKVFLIIYYFCNFTIDDIQELNNYEQSCISYAINADNFGIFKAIEKIDEQNIINYKVYNINQESYLYFAAETFNLEMIQFVKEKGNYTIDDINLKSLISNKSVSDILDENYSYISQHFIEKYNRLYIALKLKRDKEVYSIIEKLKRVDIEYQFNHYNLYMFICDMTTNIKIIKLYLKKANNYLNIKK